MRISDWSSDVCSSDLGRRLDGRRSRHHPHPGRARTQQRAALPLVCAGHRTARDPAADPDTGAADRKGRRLMAKQRADQLLVDRGLVESRTRAQALILAGLAFVGDRKIDKAGQHIAADAELSVKGCDHPWVSRGGIKLDHALTHLGWNVTGAVAIDVGSSTGGFTDVLLSRGAARVYAVDSGTNQLAWKLRQDARVVVHDPTSATILDRPSGGEGKRVSGRVDPGGR